MKQLLKKHYFLLFLLMLLYLASDAQNQMGNLVFQDDFRIIDTVQLEVLYQLVFIEDTLKHEETLSDHQVLQVGYQNSKYFSKLLFINDSINTILEEQNAKNLKSPPKAAAMYEIIRDKKEKTFEVTYRSDDIVFRYFEDIPELSWVIQSERKTIREYSCQKASTTFRGRKYEAWFTPEIPIREGPYKFGGLPGLILEIQDSQKQFIYTCIGIKRIKESIKIRNWQYTVTTRTKLNEFLERKHKNTVNYYKSRGVTAMIKKDGKFIEVPMNFSLPYNPIELE
ncbi:MAG: GLPGLI family protein [Bacteroidales bacterium]|jgi:GLPGLI family protein|nr:GLPGLI family protein [Bacteroidales bacterium]